MSQDLGKAIRYFRIKANMTQSELAKGIISESYLSKIENGRVKIPMDIYLLLCEKIGVDPYSNEDSDFPKICNRWFIYLLNKNIEKSTEIYNKVILHNKNILHNNLYHFIEIFKLRYFNIIDEDDKAKKQIVFLKNIEKDFNEKEKFYWLKFSGDHYFAQKNYQKSFNLYELAKKYSSFVSKKNEFSLYYMVALTASKLRRTNYSIKYAKKALNYYRVQYDLKNCAECHILLGISYQRNSDFDHAIQNYKIALNIAKEIGDSNILAISKQNFGKIYSVLGQSDKAIEFYLKSYDVRKNASVTKKIIPISSLMKEYYKNGDLLEAKMWMEKGRELSKQLSDSYSNYTYEFQVYDYLINKNEKELINIINNKILPSLSRKNLKYEKHYYLKLLGDYYFEQRKYKLASMYYKYSIDKLNEAYRIK